MNLSRIFDPALSAEELRGFTRTVAEIEWLMLILVLLYQVVLPLDQEASAALAMAMFFFAAFVLSFHYANFYRTESHWKITIETAMMILFVTWVLAYTGGAESPLHDLYILVIIVAALTLGKIVTLAEMALIAGCYVWLAYPLEAGELMTLPYGAKLLAQIAPMLLVAYITSMLSADLRQAYSHVKHLSETDELTGVLNMRAFATIAERVAQQAGRYARPFSVLMIDSDSLKQVNDTLGHETGNRLLQQTVECIQGRLRQTDLVARYGGDEFVALLPETPCNGAAGVAERIRKSIETIALASREHKVSVTVSIGVACYPNHGVDFESVLEKADQAMYASKSAGKNRVTVSAT
ncbi:MAG TPA: GGDEF domain-containing protein [Burkholderiales bacterium]|nr:GGDEF domain-containing protein [Burkholderiales bacterium]